MQVHFWPRPRNRGQNIGLEPEAEVEASIPRPRPRSIVLGLGFDVLVSGHGLGLQPRGRGRCQKFDLETEPRLKFWQRPEGVSWMTAQVTRTARSATRARSSGSTRARSVRADGYASCATWLPGTFRGSSRRRRCSSTRSVLRTARRRSAASNCGTATESSPGATWRINPRRRRWLTSDIALTCRIILSRLLSSSVVRSRPAYPLLFSPSLYSSLRSADSTVLRPTYLSSHFLFRSLLFC